MSWEAMGTTTMIKGKKLTGFKRLMGKNDKKKKKVEREKRCLTQNYWS